ncbi:SGNH/GDSL hydrolase family protein [Cloacibacterium caeni]|uniref:SGNH/GDSL hydrolase family protein n=1 Tax=Cloacibacterium caeni TaxID=2004710 RepID=UPI001BCA83B8|nr:SGNH/GDSL hydrolase family protein [Cloacibacterium caeni]
MKKIILSAFAISALTLVSCNTDFERDVNNMTVSTGNADFKTFVSIGNSLTSGYRDGALYLDGQKESFPSMLAQQMALAGGTQTFTQPLMPNNVGGFTDLFAASGNTEFYGKLTLSQTLSPTPSAPGANLDVIGGAGKYFNNMGVPGAKSFHLVTPGYGSAANLATGKANPYFVRFATSATTTVLADAAAQKPSFYTLWIGNNDVLSYATSGGSGIDQKGNLDPSTYGSNDISDPNVVANVIKTVITSLKTAYANSKGAIANIPYVTSIPYFTTVPATPITGLTSAQASQLNAAYATYNGGLLTLKNLGAISTAEYNARLIKFSENGVNGAVIVDKDLTNLSGYNLPSLRQTTSKDIILLPALTLLRDTTIKGGTATPLADKYVLTEKEAAKVIAATDAYNASISSLATAYGLALVDANAKMKELGTTSGIQYNGVKYTASFITGGTFSLDGVHPNGRGYAIIANTFISAINNTFYSTLPFVDINAYSGVTFPK